MPRKPRKVRLMMPVPLTKAWREFFETGANGNSTEEDGDIFLVDTHEKAMLTAWLPYREKFLVEWKRQKRRGLPWIEKKLKEWEK